MAWPWAPANYTLNTTYISRSYKWYGFRASENNVPFQTGFHQTISVFKFFENKIFVKAIVLNFFRRCCKRPNRTVETKIKTKLFQPKEGRQWKFGISTCVPGQWLYSIKVLFSSFEFLRVTRKTSSLQKVTVVWLILLSWIFWYCLLLIEI